MCTCGVPSQANWYVEMVIGRDVDGGTETEHVDLYACDTHCNEATPASHLAESAIEDGWAVIEANATRIR